MAHRGEELGLRAVGGFGDVAGVGEIVGALLDGAAPARRGALRAPCRGCRIWSSMSLKESTSCPVSSSERRSAFCVKSLVCAHAVHRLRELAERPRDRALQARGDEEADGDRRDGADRRGEQRLAQARRRAPMCRPAGRGCRPATPPLTIGVVTKKEPCVSMLQSGGVASRAAGGERHADAGLARRCAPSGVADFGEAHVRHAADRVQRLERGAAVRLGDRRRRRLPPARRASACNSARFASAKRRQLPVAADAERQATPPRRPKRRSAARAWLGSSEPGRSATECPAGLEFPL